MYAAHYGLGIGLAALRPRRGSAFYLAVAAAAPDVPGMLLWAMGLENAGRATHQWHGMLVIGAALIALGVLLRQPRLTLACAVLAMLSHVALDRLNKTIYADPSIDFAVEGACLVLGSILYARAARLDWRQRGVFCTAIGVTAALQAVFDLLL